MFKFDVTSNTPPIHETIQKILSRPMEMSLEAAITTLSGMILSHQRVQLMWETSQTSEGWRGDAASEVKATAYEILMRYSGDITTNSHTAAMFMTAMHHAVERVLGKMRVTGIIL